MFFSRKRRPEAPAPTPPAEPHDGFVEEARLITVHDPVHDIVPPQDESAPMPFSNNSAEFTENASAGPRPAEAVAPLGAPVPEEASAPNTEPFLETEPELASSHAPDAPFAWLAGHEHEMPSPLDTPSLTPSVAPSESWYDDSNHISTTAPLSTEVTPMNSPIVFVSGSKGGVGKSITTMAVLDYLQTKSAMCKLVESDTSNPDVFKSYNRAAECEEVDLDDVEGWIDLVNICESPSFKTVVVNTPARNNAGVRQHGEVLLNALTELSRPLVTLWVINRQRDSLDLLSEYLDIMPGGVVHVVLNGYFGDLKKFELYHNSPLRERIAAQEGKELYLPDLADRVTDELYSKRITLAQAAQQLKIGDRTELQRWRNNVAQLFGSIQL